MLFAHSRALAGQPSLHVEMPEGGALPDLWEAIAHTCPPLLALRESSRIAVNREFATEGTRIYPHDEVALIPPVSGGAA